jgi:hypothetical protein
MRRGEKLGRGRTVVQDRLYQYRCLPRQFDDERVLETLRALIAELEGRLQKVERPETALRRGDQPIS